MLITYRDPRLQCPIERVEVGGVRVHLRFCNVDDFLSFFARQRRFHHVQLQASFMVVADLDFCWLVVQLPQLLMNVSDTALQFKDAFEEVVPKESIMVVLQCGLVWLMFLPE